tara:strand:- start:232 stop:336 length:105 start_codon:yes stop_codon:yes gene_type:complete
VSEKLRQKLKRQVHLGFVIAAFCIFVAITADIFF